MNQNQNTNEDLNDVEECEPTAGQNQPMKLVAKSTKVLVVGKKTPYTKVTAGAYQGRLIRRFYKNGDRLELRRAHGVFAQIGYVEYWEIVYGEYDSENHCYHASQPQYFDTNMTDEAVVNFTMRSGGKTPHKASLAGMSLADIKARQVARHEEVLIQKLNHITPVVYDVDPIPPGANPFHHDQSSMGTPLVRGWIAMHEGFDSEERPLDMKWVILVNTRTGQRIKVELPKDADNA